MASVGQCCCASLRNYPGNSSQKDNTVRDREIVLGGSHVISSVPGFVLAADRTFALVEEFERD